MKQPNTMKEAKSMVKERWLDHRLEKLSQQNDDLRDEVDTLRHDLDEERDRSKETLVALSKSRRRPGRLKWLVLAGGAYVMGAKAGRARYDQIREWARSIAQRDGDGATAPGAVTSTSMTETPGTKI